MYDIIGDVHGHADALEALLTRHGYVSHGRGYRHPERKLIFLGDLIDRGPNIRRTVEIARAMVDAGDAIVVMGNHEFNALCYHTPDPNNPGQYLRPRTAANIEQHKKTLAEYPREEELADLINWFYTLPMWLGTEEFRAVHASWHTDSISFLKQHFPTGRINAESLSDCALSSGRFYVAVENVLKGPEGKLPGQASFRDKYGRERHSIRLKWFLPSERHTYRSYSFPEQPHAPEEPLRGIDLQGYPPQERPVFFGHYWLEDTEPAPVAPNCFCLDYSVAHGGFLCGYRVGEGFIW